MLEPWRKQVPHAVVKGIKNAQSDIERACKGLLYWGPEYLMTVNIFKSLLRIEALENSMVLEMKASEVSEVKTRGPKLQNSRIGRHCRCDMVLWSGLNSRRAVIEVKRYAQDCLKDVPRVLQLLRETPSMYYGVLAASMQKEVKNGDVLEAKSEIVNDLEALSKNIRTQTAKSVKLFPDNVPREIHPLYAEDGNGEGKDLVWRPVCFVIYRG